MSNVRRHLVAALVIFVVILQAGGALAQVDIASAVARPGFDPNRTSIVVADAASGEVLASHLPDLALNPASCAKLITSLTALKVLRPNHRFRTIFASDGKPKDGTVGTLYVKGEGDPSLTNEELLKLGAHLRAYGIERITGGIVIDNSYFDSFEYPRKGGSAGRAYTAKTSAVAVNFNSIGIEVRPTRAGRRATVELKPPVDIYDLSNKVVTRGRSRIGITMDAGKGGGRIIVSGRISPRAMPATFWRSIQDPVEYAGAVIAYQFGESGIQVEGPVRSGTMPEGAHIIAEQFSKPLNEIIYDMNKLSTNFVAEQITKALGAAKLGAPGSTEKGIAVFEGFLSSIGIPKGTIVLENGSGLSSRSRVTASQLVKVLVTAYHDRKVRSDFIDSLSVLGVDGTMKGWTKMAPELAGTVYAKTGTLNGVSTLAGYVTMPNRRLAAFAILANGLPRGIWAAKEAQLGVVRSIAGFAP